MKLFRLTPALCALSLFTSLPACGGGDTSEGDGDASIDGDGDTGSGGSGAGETGSGGSGTGGALASLSTPREETMSVDILRLSFRADRQELRATAASRTVLTNPEVLEGIELPDAEQDADRCHVQEVGDCSVHYCTRASTPFVAPPEVLEAIFETTTRNAGVLTASFPQESGVLAAELIPTETLEYPTSAPFAPAGVLISGDPPGTLTAQGNHIPAFTVPLPFPLALLATNAVIPATGSLPVSTINVSQGAGIVLTWDRGAPGVRYMIQEAVDSPPTEFEQRLRCDFDSMAGQGSIDASLLSHIDLGQIYDTFTSVISEFTAGTDAITLRMFAEVTTPERTAGVRLVIVP